MKVEEETEKQFTEKDEDRKASETALASQRAHQRASRSIFSGRASVAASRENQLSMRITARAVPAIELSENTTVCTQTTTDMRHL